MNQKEKTTAKWQDFFSLSYDQAHPDMIDNAIRSNVRVAGTNLWVLMFAILIASIGLNVNSTAVIIGAMLISPLMSPIVGMGYGVAVGDVSLIRLSFRNMLIFIGISLLASTLYFLITPLQQAQSELLARTTPTLWDVLIAFFGGSAGIIAITRKEVSNTIPGVAIATALMPPLCTAGYGLAHHNWEYFFGAFYLFSINCVFIAFATLLFSRLMKLPRRGLVTDSTRKFQRLIITIIVLVVMLPSGFLAMNLVKKELFNTAVNTAISQIQKEEGFFVLRHHLDEKSKSVGLVINGSGDSQTITEKLTQELRHLNIKDPKVTILYAGGDTGTNIAELKQEFELCKDKNNRFVPVPPNPQAVERELQQSIVLEILAQYPNASQIHIAKGLQWQASADTADGTKDHYQTTTLISLNLPTALSDNEQQRLTAWLRQRLKDDYVDLYITVKPQKPNDNHEILSNTANHSTQNPP